VVAFGLNDYDNQLPIKPGDAVEPFTSIRWNYGVFFFLFMIDPGNTVGCAWSG
jgi:hypothetical protein